MSVASTIEKLNNPMADVVIPLNKSDRSKLYHTIQIETNSLLTGGSFTIYGRLSQNQPFTLSGDSLIFNATNILVGAIYGSYDAIMVRPVSVPISTYNIWVRST